LEYQSRDFVIYLRFLFYQSYDHSQNGETKEVGFDLVDWFTS